MSAAGSHTVGDDDNLGELMDEHDRRQAEDTEQSQRHQDDDDRQRQPDVLQHDPPDLPCVMKHLGEVPQIVTHQGHIRCLDRDVGPHGSHGNSDVRSSECGSVVDPVADHRSRALATELTYEADLVLWA